MVEIDPTVDMADEVADTCDMEIVNSPATANKPASVSNAMTAGSRMESETNDKVMLHAIGAEAPVFSVEIALTISPSKGTATDGTEVATERQNETQVSTDHRLKDVRGTQRPGRSK
ncbi:unnamed protein product [Aphanomyces euteiches]